MFLGDNMSENVKKKDWNRPVKEGSKSTAILKKLYTIILVCFIVLLFLNNYVKKHTINSRSIRSLVGNNVSVNVGSKTSLLIREFSINPFVAFLKSYDYESAYKMCTDEYKKYFTLQDFTDTFSKIDVSSIALREVKAKTDLCYEAKIVYRLLEDKKAVTNASGELVQVEGEQFETTFMLFPSAVNSEVIRISPNKFLYGYSEETFKKDGLEVYVEKCLVYTDSVEIHATIKNNSWFSNISIHSVGVGLEEGLLRKFEFDKELAKGEEVKVERIIKDTDFFMPNNFQIERVKNEKKLRTYAFYFDETK